MCLRRPLLCIALLFIATLALAEDKPSTPQVSNDMQIALGAPATMAAANLPQLYLPASPGDLWKPESTSPAKLHKGTLATVDGNTCYTMRSYKVERTERMSDEVTPRAYTTCQMASGFRVRSADGEPDELQFNER
jgi:hypothetical protein